MFGSDALSSQMIDTGCDHPSHSGFVRLSQLAGSRAERTVPTSESRGEGAGSKMPRAAKVLIVEDEALVALDICSSLGDSGYEIVGPVSTETAAVHMAANLRPDLVIMDIQLKGEGDGFRASERIAAEQDIPILFITAYKTKEALARLDEQPTANSVVFKPFTREALLEAVKTTLKPNQG